MCQNLATPAPSRDDRPEVANPLLESFVEPQKICATNSSCPRQTLTEKETQICHGFVQTIGLLLIVALSLCFNHLVLSTFWQCRSAIPQRSAKPIVSIHHIVEYPSLRWLRTIFYYMYLHHKAKSFAFSEKDELIYLLKNSFWKSRHCSRDSLQESFEWKKQMTLLLWSSMIHKCNGVLQHSFMMLK